MPLLPFSWLKWVDETHLIRGGNRPGQVLKGLSLAYDEFLRPESSLWPIKDFYFGSA